MTSQHRWIGVSLLLAVAVLSGCASSGRTSETTPEVADSTPETAPEGPVQPDVSAELPEQPASEPEPSQPEAEEEVAPGEPEESGAYGPKTWVLPSNEPEAGGQPRTLAEAARRSREQRGESQEPIAVITDNTLSEFATGELTVASEPAATTPPPDDSALGDLLSQEEYWRTRVREARIEWRDLVDEISELEGQVNKLRNRFYAEDDGFFRDSQIKPSWDRALDRLAEAQLAVVAAQTNVQTVLKEGRQAGALPGWLREGSEYEPVQDDGGRNRNIHEPGEPQVVEEDGGR